MLNLAPGRRVTTKRAHVQMHLQLQLHDHHLKLQIVLLLHPHSSGLTKLAEKKVNLPCHWNVAEGLRTPVLSRSRHADARQRQRRCFEPGSGSNGYKL